VIGRTSQRAPERTWRVEERIMRLGIFARFLTVKILIRAAFTALSLSSIGAAHSQPSPYHALGQNYHQSDRLDDGVG
jgi:hypothetical protein